MVMDTKAARFDEGQVAQWRDEGAVLLQGFFTDAEIASAREDMQRVYGDRRQGEGEGNAHREDHGETIGVFDANQFRNFDDMPFDCSPALNLLGLNPDLVAFAQAALGCEHVHLYQAHAWAKFTGQADYEQPFHCDFKNHTLTVPSDDHRLRTVNFMIYLTDVTEEHGAIHYVPNSASDPITGSERAMFLDGDVGAQHALKAVERTGAARAGTVFAYGIDVYHRGSNLTAPDAHRYTLTASYKKAGNDMIGWSAWPFSFLKPWHLIFHNATPEQLACIGVPAPGDPFWTERTLSRAQDRWPGWDMKPYRDALST
jgi:ectoine hydroxylase-related dioxygenase (phytanoyl-CoA dioxygenase family)